MTLLTVTDLNVSFGRRRRSAVTEVSFELAAGQRLGLIGESGSGKSVTALAVMGLLPETAHLTGSILLNGVELIGRPERELARLRGNAMTMVFQEPMTALDPTMTVGRQVAEVLRLHQGAEAGPARERVVAMLGRVGLTDPARVADSFPHQLSGGQRQRCILAMALFNGPDLVICDEPTTALDVTVQARVLTLLNEVLDAEGAACLFISHDLAVVSQVCTDVLVMLEGRIVEAGPVTKLFQNPEHPYTRGLVATARIDAVPPGQRLPTVEDFLERRGGGSMTDSLYQVSDLTRVFGKGPSRVVALDGVSLEVASGQRLGIVGESGSGKSTLIRLMAALDRPTAGSVRYQGEEIGGRREASLGYLRSSVQLVFQDPRSSLNPRMKVRDIITEPLRSPLVRRHLEVGTDHRRRLAEVMEAVDLPLELADRYPHEFSGGQRQRIAIARALAPKPSVLIADEPVSALDVSVRAQVLNLLADLVDAYGLTLIFVSHDLTVVRHLCDSMIVMRGGRIEERGSTREVFENPQADYTKALWAAVPRIRTDSPAG